MANAEQLRASRETILDFDPNQMRLFNGIFDLIENLQHRVAVLEHLGDTRSNLLDPNGYLEAVIRRAADDSRADEIIDRLRGGPS
jgi:hypothetical protein